MTKKEVALIRQTIDELQGSINESNPMFPLSEETKIDLEARIDALVWVLVATGNAEGLDPSLRAEEFE